MSEWCPHCSVYYDESNESQPCCGYCGHPISCDCYIYKYQKTKKSEPIDKWPTPDKIPKTIRDEDIPLFASKHKWYTVFYLVRKGANIETQEKKRGYNALHFAAVDDSRDAVKTIISLGANLDITTKSGHSALILSNFSSHEMGPAYLLIKNGCDVNIKDPLLGQTAIFKAARNPNLCEDLINAGADLTIIDKNGTTVLHEATKYSNLYLVKKALEFQNVNAKDHLGFTPLHEAVWLTSNNEPIIIKMLIKAGADVNARDKNNDTPIIKLTSTITSYRHRHLFENMKLLIEAGADTNILGNSGSALHKLCGRRISSRDFDKRNMSKAIISAIKYLIKSGCNINAIYDNGGPPIHECFIEKISRLLINEGADLNVIGDDGENLLHAAARTKNLYLFNKALDIFSVHDKNHNGDTPLNIAVRTLWDYEVIKILLESGSDVNSVNNKGQTPLLSLALYYSQGELLPTLKMLVNAGADIYEKDNEGNTFLHLISKYFFGGSDREELTDNYLSAIKYMISLGANIDDKNNQGTQPFIRGKI